MKPLKLVLELIALATIVATCSMTAWFWNALPQVIPVHFNLVGQADGWGSKAWLALMPALGIFAYALMTAASRFPSLSAKRYRTAEQNARHFEMAKSLMPWLKAETGLIYAFVQWSMINTALGAVSGLNPWIMLALVVVLLVTIGIHLRMLFFKSSK